jgi:hypothetical protein
VRDPVGPAFTPWDFVSRFSDASHPERSVVRQSLARDIISARSSEIQKVALANFAIRRFRAGLA